MDKFIVRISILLLNAYILVVLLFALNGVDISIYDYLFTNSMLFGIVLSTLVNSQGRYHCKWIRFMCYDLILIPIINYIDAKYYLFSSAESCIYYYCFISGFSILITTILAIKHFIRVRKLNKIRSYEIRRRNEIKD